MSSEKKSAEQLGKELYATFAAEFVAMCRRLAKTGESKNLTGEQALLNLADAVEFSIHRGIQ